MGLQPRLGSSRLAPQSDRCLSFQQPLSFQSLSPRWTWWPTAAQPRYVGVSVHPGGPPAAEVQPPAAPFAFAERGGCCAPDAADRPGPAALPGAAGERGPLGDVSAGATAVVGGVGGTPIPSQHQEICVSRVKPLGVFQPLPDSAGPLGLVGCGQGVLGGGTAQWSVSARLRGGWTYRKIPLGGVKMLPFLFVTVESLFFSLGDAEENRIIIILIVIIIVVVVTTIIIIIIIVHFHCPTYFLRGRNFLCSGRTVPSRQDPPARELHPVLHASSPPFSHEQPERSHQLHPKPPPRVAGDGTEVGLPGSVSRMGCFLSWQREPENRVLEDFGAEERGSFGAHLPAAH